MSWSKYLKEYHLVVLAWGKPARPPCRPYAVARVSHRKAITTTSSSAAIDHKCVFGSSATAYSPIFAPALPRFPSCLLFSAIMSTTVLACPSRSSSLCKAALCFKPYHRSSPHDEGFLRSRSMEEASCGPPQCRAAAPASASTTSTLLYCQIFATAQCIQQNLQLLPRLGLLVVIVREVETGAFPYFFLALPTRAKVRLVSKDNSLFKMDVQCRAAQAARDESLSKRMGERRGAQSSRSCPFKTVCWFGSLLTAIATRKPAATRYQ